MGSAVQDRLRCSKLSGKGSKPGKLVKTTQAGAPLPLERVPHLENSTRCHAPFLSQLQCTPFAAKQDRKLQQQFVGAPNLLVVSPTSPVPRLPALTLVISHSRNSSGTMMNSTAWRPRPGLCMISPARPSWATFASRIVAPHSMLSVILAAYSLSLKTSRRRMWKRPSELRGKPCPLRSFFRSSNGP